MGRRTAASRPQTISIEVEVRYAETDQMGVVHHAVYPVWFELARTRLCAATGLTYAEIEQMGYYLMVTGLQADFRSSARYGDTVVVRCEVSRLGSRGLTFDYEVGREDELLARGSTSHVWINGETGKPCRIPGPLEKPFARLAG
jgi:acyl-CoA thioester hydrolase